MKALQVTEPYPGLRPFASHEDAIFYGRAEQVNEMLATMEDHAFLAVVGSSGSGKSSLVRAGLIPALEEGFLASEYEQWAFLTMCPGASPYAALAEAFSREIADVDDVRSLRNIEASLRANERGLLDLVTEYDVQKNILLLVDQFEEIFRYRELMAHSNEAAAFVNLMLESSLGKEHNIYVVMTMRSEFIGDCDTFYGLPEAMNRCQFLTPRLKPHQVRECVKEPVRVFGGSVQPAVVNRILRDLNPQGDELPLMQHALMRSWACAKKRGEDLCITVDDYEAVGELASALSYHADACYEELANDSERQIAKTLFLALSDWNHKGVLVRNPCSVKDIADLAEVGTEKVIQVAKVFLQHGRNFIVSSGGDLDHDSTLDISHEALLRQWRQLRKWLNKHQQAIHTCRRLNEDAIAHSQGKKNLMWTQELSALDRSNILSKAWFKRLGLDYTLTFGYLSKSEESLKQHEERLRKKALLKRYLAIGGGLALFITGTYFVNAKSWAAIKVKKEAIAIERQNIKIKEEELIFEQETIEHKKEANAVQTDIRNIPRQNLGPSGNTIADLREALPRYNRLLPSVDMIVSQKDVAGISLDILKQARPLFENQLNLVFLTESEVKQGNRPYEAYHPLLTCLCKRQPGSKWEYSILNSDPLDSQQTEAKPFPLFPALPPVTRANDQLKFYDLLALMATKAKEKYTELSVKSLFASGPSPFRYKHSFQIDFSGWKGFWKSNRDLIQEILDKVNMELRKKYPGGYYPLSSEEAKIVCREEMTEKGSSLFLMPSNRRFWNGGQIDDGQVMTPLRNVEEYLLYLTNIKNKVVGNVTYSINPETGKRQKVEAYRGLFTKYHEIAQAKGQKPSPVVESNLLICIVRGGFYSRNYPDQTVPYQQLVEQISSITSDKEPLTTRVRLYNVMKEAGFKYYQDANKETKASAD